MKCISGGGGLGGGICSNVFSSCFLSASLAAAWRCAWVCVSSLVSRSRLSETGSTVVQLICAGIGGAGVIDTELLIWPELRCFMLLEGAFVGVIVTDGVMVRLDPARLSPIGRRWPGVLGVRVAPPGSEGCLAGGLVTGVMLIGDPRLTGVAVTDLEDFE